MLNGAAVNGQPARPDAVPAASAPDAELDDDAAPGQAACTADNDAPADRLLDELCMQLMLYDAARSYSLFRQVRFAVFAGFQKSFYTASPGSLPIAVQQRHKLTDRS